MEVIKILSKYFSFNKVDWTTEPHSGKAPCWYSLATYREHLLGGPLSPHVGVMDLLENHPGFIMFAHLESQRQRHECSWLQMLSFHWNGRPYTPKQHAGSEILDTDPLATGEDYGSPQQVPSQHWKDNQVVKSKGKWHMLLSPWIITVSVKLSGSWRRSHAPHWWDKAKT